MKFEIGPEGFGRTVVDLDVVAIGPEAKCRRIKVDGERGHTFAVTVLDRMNRESKPIFLTNK